MLWRKTSLFMLILWCTMINIFTWKCHCSNLQNLINHTIEISLSYLKNAFLRLFWTQFTLRFLSKRPFKLRKWATCYPNPPIDPSSTVSKTSCSLAHLLINSASNGLQKKAHLLINSASNELIKSSSINL